MQEVQASGDERQQVEVSTYAGYHSIISGVDRKWEYGGFALPDGTVWRSREPDAAVIVEGDLLRVRVERLTRSHDRVQILDNAKNMFFSTSRFVIPDDGAISFEWDMSARSAVRVRMISTMALFRLICWIFKPVWRLTFLL